MSDYANINDVIRLVESQHSKLESKVDDAIKNLEDNAAASASGNSSYDEEIEADTSAVTDSNKVTAKVGTLSNSPSIDTATNVSAKQYSSSLQSVNSSIALTVGTSEVATASLGTVSDRTSINDIEIDKSELYSTVEPSSISIVNSLITPVEISGNIRNTTPGIESDISNFNSVSVKDTTDTGWTPVWFDRIKGTIPDVNVNDVLSIIGQPSIDSYSYTSDFLDSIINAAVDIYGGGYSDMLSLSLWLRGQAQDIQLLSDSIEEVVRSFAAKGFPCPTSKSQSAVTTLLNKYQTDNASKTFATTRELADISQDFHFAAISAGIKAEEIKSKITLAYKDLYFSTVESIVQKHAAVLRSKVAALRLDLDMIKAEIDASIGNAELEAQANVSNAGIVSKNIRNNIKIYEAMLRADIADGNINVDISRANASTASSTANRDIGYLKAQKDVFNFQIKQDIAKGEAEAQTEEANAKIVNLLAGEEVAKITGAVAAYSAEVRQDLAQGETDIATEEANLSYVGAKISSSKATLDGLLSQYKAEISLAEEKASSAIGVEHANVAYTKAKALEQIEKLKGQLAVYDQNVLQDVTKAEIEIEAEKVNYLYAELEFQINLANTAASIDLANNNLKVWTQMYDARLQASSSIVESLNSLMYGWSSLVTKVDITEESFDAE